MRIALAVVLICLAAASPALAGAWLREQGSGFLSLGGTVYEGNPYVLGGSYVEYDTRAYAEYGLRPRLTVGLDLNDHPGVAGHALAFALLPLGNPDWRTRFALQLGAGGHHLENQWMAMYKAGLAAGRGFETRWGNGWMGAEAAIEIRRGLPDPIFKLDAVIGMSSGWRLRPLLKLESYSSSGQEIGWAVTPALMYTTRKGGTWVLGVKRTSLPERNLGLSLEIWRDF